MEALLLRIPEAAAQLGVSRAKLYELIAADLQARRPGVPQPRQLPIQDHGLRADPDGGVNTLTTLNLEEPASTLAPASLDVGWSPNGYLPIMRAFRMARFADELPVASA